MQSATLSAHVDSPNLKIAARVGVRRRKLGDQRHHPCHHLPTSLPITLWYSVHMPVVATVGFFILGKLQPFGLGTRQRPAPAVFVCSSCVLREPAVDGADRWVLAWQPADVAVAQRVEPECRCPRELTPPPTKGSVQRTEHMFIVNHFDSKWKEVVLPECRGCPQRQSAARIVHRTAPQGSCATAASRLSLHAHL